MSLRQIKKLQGATKAAPDQVDEKAGEDQEEEEEQPQAQAKKIKNVFDMFQNDDDDDNDDDNDDEESENKANKGKGESGEAKAGDKKKKKKKNKKAKKAKNAEKAEDQDEVEEKKVNNEDDEFDKALAEFKEESKEREIHRPCLELNEKALDYNKELARFFKNAKLTTKDYATKEGRNNRERGMLKHMKNDRNARNFKSYKLVYTDTAHMFNPERFSCEFVGHNKYKMKVYALEPTKKYAELQEAFDSLRNTGDPDHLAEFVRMNPFHTDAMFSIAELLRLQGDYKQVNQLLENIIFMYEDSFGYEVNIFEHDDVMLSFDANEYTRTLFAALNRFMDVLGKKGCYKSAFEYNKVLIKLNPYDDPAGGLLSYDYNAISSQSYDALLDLPHKFGKQYYKSDEFSLIYMPNFAYSCALAKFLKIVQDEDLGISQYAGVTEEDFKQAIKTDMDPLEQNANVMLMHAILLFPSVIKELAEANEYQKQTQALGGDKFSEWQKKSYKEIFGHKFWEQGKVEYIYPCMNINNNEDIEGIKKAIEIYIERSKILWKNNKVMLWVKACVGMILNQIQQGNLNFEEYTEGLFTAKFKYKLPFEMARCKGLMRSNFSDRVERIDFNNIPDNVGGPQQRERPGLNPMNPNSGFLNLLLGSLLPWNHLPRNNQQQPRDGPHDPDDVEIEEEEF